MLKKLKVFAAKCAVTLLGLAILGIVILGINQAVDVYGQYREESIRHGIY